MHTSSPRPGRWSRLAGIALIALSAAACGATATGSAGPPTTVAHHGAWFAAFTPVLPPSPVNALAAVDCTDARRCWALGSTLGAGGSPGGATVVTTFNGGASWSPQAVPAGTAYLSGISCSGRATCALVGQTATGQGTILTTTSGGTTWRPAPLPAGILDVTAVDCRPDGSCVALGSTGAAVVALISAAADAPWAAAGALPAPVTGATAISCIDQQCWVAGRTAVDPGHVAAAAAVTTDGGATWTALALPPGIGSLDGIACLPTAVAGATTTTAGAPTTSAPHGATSSTAATTSTVATTVPPTTTTTAPPGAGVDCTAVGTTATDVDGSRDGHGVLLASDDGGATWTSPPVPGTVAALTGVSCPAVGSCLAVGAMVALSLRAGVVLASGAPADPWAAPGVVALPQTLAGVSCPSTTRCVMVGESLTVHLTGT